MRPKLELTEEDGYAALRAHLLERAFKARERHPDVTTEAGLRRLLADPEVMRFPSALVFDAAPLMAGEFAWARPRGERPADGFVLTVHTAFEGRDEDVAWLAAYHIPSINYLDVAGSREAELFGAALLGVEVEAYYTRLCALADELGPAPEPVNVSFGEIPTGGGSSCGGGCGCADS
jgi:hypothetical protein